MKRLILIFVLSLFVSMSLFGVVFGNHSDSSYDGDEVIEKLSNKQSQLKTMIILGAGHFLNSSAGFQQLLQRVEMDELTGSNYDDLRLILNNVIASLESAKATYYELKTLAAGLPYNQIVIDSLKSFDYTGFKTNNGLNNVIFSRVELLLSGGNVTGVYEEIFSKTAELLELLYAVKKSVDNDIFPGITLLWKINQGYFDTLLFGQYVAMIFNTINQ